MHQTRFAASKARRCQSQLSRVKIRTNGEESRSPNFQEEGRRLIEED